MKADARPNAIAELHDLPDPRDFDSELMALRGIVLDKKLPDVSDLTADHFAVVAHQQIFAAIATLREEQKPVDTAHLDAELRERGHLDAIGGRAKLAEMLAGEYLPAKMADYLRVLREKYSRRLLVRHSERILQQAHSSQPVHDILADAALDLAQAKAECDGDNRGARPLLVSMDKIEAHTIEWFWPARFALGKFGLIIGDPGDGKSLLAVDLAARTTRGSGWLKSQTEL